MPNHLQALQQLMPQGAAWPVSDPDTTLYKLLAALAPALDTFEHDATHLLDELHPGKTTQLLPEWKALLNLPNDCIQPETLEEWRRVLHARYVATGGASKGYFESIINALQLEAGIIEQHPFRLGKTPLNSPFNTGDRPYEWALLLGEGNVLPFRLGASRLGEPFNRLIDNTVTCLLDELKPAATTLRYQVMPDYPHAGLLDQFCNTIYPARLGLPTHEPA